MRYITIPKPVVLETVDAVDGQCPTLTLQEMVVQQFIALPMWRESDDAVESAINVADAFADVKTGDVVPVLDEDWERLKKSIQSFQLNPVVARYVLKLVRAVTSASTKKPESEEGASKSEKE